MRPEDRRRLGALASLVLGIFFGLTLIRAVPTGPLGQGLGAFLWRTLGAGALGLPLLGIGLALAGFDRVPRLDMKRMGFLLGGLALLIPFTLAVVTNVQAPAFDPPLAEWSLRARASGLLPGFAAQGVIQLIGQPGGLLLAFLALSALTLATLAWHPLQRLEAGRVGAAGPDANRPVPEPLEARMPRGGRPEVHEHDEEEAIAGSSPSPRRREGKARAPALIPPGRTGTPDTLLPPIDLLKSPPPQDTAADSAQLDRLG
ncbi:MAG TPA: hypothetical protein VF187_01735, partial [Gemmatimonadales bacterium]